MLVSKDLILVNERLNKSGVSLLGNEHPHLWDSTSDDKQQMQTYFQEKFNAEQKAFSYYFGYSFGSTFLLLVLGGLLLWWISFNLKYLKRVHQMESLEIFQFRYLNQGAILPVIVLILNIAIAINLYAPALFIEFTHLILLIALTILFKKCGLQKLSEIGFYWLPYLSCSALWIFF